MSSTKKVYLFEEGHAGMKDLLGGKGANLAEMARIGLPVPPGFIITTEACNAYLNADYLLPEGLMEDVRQAVSQLESRTGKHFGNAENPLLLSVRSGAKFSMPGMMETILNLGLNEQTIQGLIAQSGNERFAWDTYRRFVGMFSGVVLGIPKDEFEQRLQQEKKRQGAQLDTDLNAATLKTLTQQYKDLVREKTGQAFPDDPAIQLQMAIEAVFRSWHTPRAVVYRDYHHIDHHLGTAVNVQAMVFGNLGDDSATGVAFTRNPATGENLLYGEYLINAQGEDVVAGIRTPHPVALMEKEFPECYRQLQQIAHQLEKHYRDIQDMEFTIENNRFYILQTRTGKRTIQAAVKIAVDMVHEGLIPGDEAILRIDANQLPHLLMPTFDPAEKKKSRLLATGINASPGAATGTIVFEADEVVRLAGQGEKVILVRPETSPDDIHGLLRAEGVLTTHGGNTSHAAVVARGLGKPCVVGCEALEIDLKAKTMSLDGKVLKAGDLISIDGSTGEVFEGCIATMPPSLGPELATLLGWADRHRKMEIWANADTPGDAQKALEYGATGIGLCRTEHMFMARERLYLVHELILAESDTDRQQALDKLLPMQREDFKGIFTVMDGHPVTVRLLDPPLHEFLPNYEHLLEEVLHMQDTGHTGPELERKETLLKKVGKLREANPMMGFRGCRVGLLYPDIYNMQMRAIMEAAIDCRQAGVDVRPKIMIPLISDAQELKRLKEQLSQVAEDVMHQRGMPVGYRFGTMIETPRAALTAKKVAEFSDFFSFGTNDLTQMTYGFSRDDAEEKFLTRYQEQGILSFNPFETLDTDGVGRLVAMACEEGSLARPGLKLSLCGEHGGEAKSVEFCHHVGLHSVSCSPFRVPVARLAAAQAALKEKSSEGEHLLASV
jgi:pyruvate,orthophosphate dikinase